MKRFVVKSGAFASSIMLTVLAAYLLMPSSDYALMAALIDKHARLTAAPSPKLVIVGGSSSAFGIDSRRLDEALGQKYEVVNTALHGGLGLHFMLAFVKPHLRPGDVVLVVPEYSLLYDAHSDATALNEALGEYPDAWRYVSPFQSKIVPATVLLTIQKRARKFLGVTPVVEDSLYTRRGFNRYGDLVSHLRVEPRRDIDPVPLHFRTPAPKAVEMLNAFSAYCRANDVRVFMTFSPYPRPYVAGGAKDEEWLHMVRETVDIPIISNPTTYLLPLDHFYDTVYHLNEKGRQVRTTRLIKDLQSQSNVFEH